MRKWSWMWYAFLFMGAVALVAWSGQKAVAMGSAPQKDVKAEESTDNEENESADADSATAASNEPAKENAAGAVQPVSQPTAQPAIDPVKK